MDVDDETNDAAHSSAIVTTKSPASAPTRRAYVAKGPKPKPVSIAALSKEEVILPDEAIEQIADIEYDVAVDEAAGNQFIEAEEPLPAREWRAYAPPGCRVEHHLAEPEAERDDTFEWLSVASLFRSGYESYPESTTKPCMSCAGVIQGKPAMIPDFACPKLEYFWGVWGNFHWCCAKRYIRDKYPFEHLAVMTRFYHFALKAAGVELSKVGFAAPTTRHARFGGDLDDDAYLAFANDASAICVEVIRPAQWVPRSIIFAMKTQTSERLARGGALVQSFAEQLQSNGVSVDQIKPPPSHFVSDCEDPSIVIDTQTGQWVDADEHTRHLSCKSTVVPHATRFTVDQFSTHQVFRRVRN